MPENTPTMWSLPEVPDNVTAVLDSTGRLLVRAPDRADALWWFGEAGKGVGYEWPYALWQFGPLTDASYEVGLADAEAVA